MIEKMPWRFAPAATAAAPGKQNVMEIDRVETAPQNT
jgi:hypothetical protein